MNYDDLVRRLRDRAGIEAEGMRIAGYGPAGGMTEFKHEWTLYWIAADTIQELQRDAAAKQARIDELMIEYCPDEITPEQWAEYERNQRAVTIDEAMQHERQG